MDIIELIKQAGAVVKTVLVILLFFSVMSWAIIIYKFRYLRSAGRETAQFLKSYRATKNMRELFALSKKREISPVVNVFKAVYAEDVLPDKQEIRRVLRRYETLEAEKLEKYLSFLATTGSTAPFIGLFGTVWGIMNSFTGIGSAGSASLAVVAPGIAEALIATAIGLVAAIPAVIAYNYYMSRARAMIIEMEDFSEELLELFHSKGHED